MNVAVHVQHNSSSTQNAFESLNLQVYTSNTESDVTGAITAGKWSKAPLLEAGFYFIIK